MNGAPPAMRRRIAFSLGGHAASRGRAPGIRFHRFAGEGWMAGRVRWPEVSNRSGRSRARLSEARRDGLLSRPDGLSPARMGEAVSRLAQLRGLVGLPTLIFRAVRLSFTAPSATILQHPDLLSFRAIKRVGATLESLYVPAPCPSVACSARTAPRCTRSLARTVIISPCARAADGRWSAMATAAGSRPRRSTNRGRRTRPEARDPGRPGRGSGTTGELGRSFPGSCTGMKLHQDAAPPQYSSRPISRAASGRLSSRTM